MSGLLAVKLRRDLRATWPRLMLMVIAIAVSLAVFGSVLLAWSVLNRETGAAYLSTEPASATIKFTPGVDAATAAEIAADARTLPGVLQASGRATFSSDVTVNGQPREIGMQVFVAAPDDPLALAKYFVRERAWPPSPQEIYLRDDALELLGVNIGDTIGVQTPGGAQAQLRVAATVYDPSLAPSGQQQSGQGYLSSAALAALGEADALDQLKFQVAQPGQTQPGQTAPSDNRAGIVAVAGDVGEWLQREYGLAVREVQVPEPYAHPHQGQADALLAALLAGAGAALLLSAILVATMLNNLFTQHIPQIGIMKAIGAGTGRIGRQYLTMTLVVATTATLVALPLAVLGGRAFAPAVLGFLGIEPASLNAEWWTYLMLLAAGVVPPVAMALVPVLKASRITVRAAIDHHGGARKPSAATGVLARLSHAPKIDRGLLMALRNTVRRPARFLLSVCLLAVAGAMFIAGMSARDGTAAVAETASEARTWDVTVRLANPVTADALTPLVKQVPGVERVEGWTSMPAAVSGPGELPLTRTYPDQGHGGVFLTAVPPDSTMLVKPTIRDGRWLEPGETGAIVLSQVTLAKADLTAVPGDTIELYLNGESTTWRLVGITEERTDSGAAYVTAEGLAKAQGEPRWSNTLRIVNTAHDEQSRVAVATAVDDTLTAAGIKVSSVESIGKAEAATGGHLEPVLVILLATALPLGVIGMVGLASTMSANVLDRTREFGVMHAIGARPRKVRRIVVAEGVIIALASCLLAILPALALTAGLGSLLGGLFFNAALPFRVSLLAVGIWTALVVLGAVLATDAAATRASRMTVREALAYL